MKNNLKILDSEQNSSYRPDRASDKLLIPACSVPPTNWGYPDGGT